MGQAGSFLNPWRAAATLASPASEPPSQSSATNYELEATRTVHGSPGGRPWEGAVDGIAILPSGRIVSAARTRGPGDQNLSKLSIWGRTEGCIREIETGDLITCITVLGDGRVDAINGRCVDAINGDHNYECVAALPGAASRVISGSGDFNEEEDEHDCPLEVWDFAGDHGRRLLQTLYGNTHWIYSVAVLLDGRRVVSGSYNGELKVFDLLEGSCLRTFNRDQGQLSAVRCVKAAPDGCFISVSRDLKLWDATEGLLRTFSWAGVCSVTALAHGLFVSGDRHGRLTCWHANGRFLRTWHEHARAITCLDVLPGGRIVSASVDHTIKIHHDYQRENELMLAADVARQRLCGDVEHIITAFL